MGTNELKQQWIEERDWEYRVRFVVPAEFPASEEIELVADGLDTVATVTLNGHRIGRTDNMFLGHRWPVRRWLRRKNELIILFTSALKYIRGKRRNFIPPTDYSDPVGGRTRIRKQQCQFGWDWGPRFVTAGIWRDIRLEAWSSNRLAQVQITQRHKRGGAVVVQCRPELARPDETMHYRLTVRRNECVVARAAGCAVEIAVPELWWPAGQGAQPLYDVELAACDPAGRIVDGWRRRVGLRTVVLDRYPDRWGESFRFLVNGRAVFIKGANWIPAHAFVGGLRAGEGARDLAAAVAANMNLVRVWGGGVYESDDFYERCDELGLLVWQDFMFACALYPSDRVFVASLNQEARYQVKRLQHHACLALWCGNNEIPQLGWTDLQSPGHRAGYERIFHDVLPKAVADCDGVTAYWPSSQWRGGWEHDNTHQTGTHRGDTHYWDVWQSRQPVKAYEQWPFRFCSEFGMQSYVSPETQATFCDPRDANIFGPTMENHQKNRAGNQIILDYVSRRYRFPRDQAALVYLSQLNQAHCMQVAVEHYRRSMPRCMGAIYWQLNDCWPVASWSSIEFTGRWKALHYAARRFYAPALVSAHVPGDETTINGNYRRSDVRHVHLYTVYDVPEPARGELRWTLFRLDDGRTLDRDEKTVMLRPGRAVRQIDLDMAPAIAVHGRDSLCLRTTLVVRGAVASEDTVLLSPPRFLALPKARTSARFELLSARRARLVFTSDVFQYRLAFDLAGMDYSASDNFFDLYPREPKSVILEFARPIAPRRLTAALSYRSLVDTY